MRGSSTVVPSRTYTGSNFLQFLMTVIAAISLTMFAFALHLTSSAEFQHSDAPVLLSPSRLSRGKGLNKRYSPFSENAKYAPDAISRSVAYDFKGRPGYIHDPYYVKNHPLDFSYFADGHSICNESLGEGQEGPRGIYALRKIRIVNWTVQPASTILCMVYSYSGRHDVVRAVAETYGQRCDGFMVASNLTEPEIGAVNLGHQGPEDYSNMWQKVRAMWIYAHDYYLDEFDWFHIGGDDMFAIAENLRYVVSLENSSEPIYMGSAMVDRKMPRKRYCGGGAGYTLSREALKQMVRNEFNFIRCNPNKTRSDEDRLVGTCLRLKVAKCKHNMDENNETRYHHYDAQFHARWDRRRPVNWDWRSLLKWHNIIAYKERLEGISETSTTFHLISDSVYRDRGLRRYHALLYGLCGDALKLEPLSQHDIDETLPHDFLGNQSTSTAGALSQKSILDS